MQKPIQALMQKEMSRKEFLATLGFGLATIAGFGSILKFLTGKSHPFQKQVGGGYGSSAYGGRRDA
jgi:Trp operon repressor